MITKVARIRSKVEYCNYTNKDKPESCMLVGAPSLDMSLPNPQTAVRMQTKETRKCGAPKEALELTVLICSYLDPE